MSIVKIKLLKDQSGVTLSVPHSLVKGRLKHPAKTKYHYSSLELQANKVVDVVLPLPSVMKEGKDYEILQNSNKYQEEVVKAAQGQSENKIQFLSQKVSALEAVHEGEKKAHEKSRDALNAERIAHASTQKAKSDVEDSLKISEEENKALKEELAKYRDLLESADVKVDVSGEDGNQKAKNKPIK